ncbi:metallophosphatase [Flagellimonas allohymeniacidonis]|uniref:Bifunctional metallophosphatase/5'-nucleotidase n=1 Tax=Flagellimonas allohymeniacidonis TaxID=2517819 RepID=A0A4Q8QEZ4_9FLAO|nr:metallophosphatase [Allomuricauda hymeniacidonis]TAI49072.1 bifunctional metallophosphatase/5'-nucleotidase [Allomuricauda hymeniacidonis]
MKRRDFLKQTAATSSFVGLGGLGLNSCAHFGQKKITILHTNDVHSHIETFPSTHARWANLGGVARRAALVESIRNENPNTLLFDAGDIFQGTPYFNFYGGELEFKLMSKLKYDAATIGNHDFDNGIGGLLAQVPHASFELLSANYDFTNTEMDGYTKPYKIYSIDGIKIGVYGLGIQLEGLVLKRLCKETQYLNPFEVALDTERQLKEKENCDLVICLSHLGYDYANPNRPSDTQLAERTSYTDLIIGGHTHTFLDKPDVRTNQKGNSVLVNQVGCYGINLGRIDFYFDSQKNASANGVSITV